MHNHRRGFSLIELVVVVALIVIVATIAIPNLQRAKLSANEASAQITMRALIQAQAQVVTAPSIDSDGNGQGEYGYFAELAGFSVTRVDSGGVVGPGGPESKLVPNALLTALGNVQNGVVNYSGYVFRVWLPGPTVGGLTPGIPEDATGGKLAGPYPDSGNCATTWCAYGWPLVRGQSGTPCYFVNERSQILLYNNTGAVKYSGIAGGPSFDAALSVAGDMRSPLAINGTASVDGNNWIVLR